MAECIHGLDAGLCDTCYPKARPEPAPAPRQRAAAKSRTLTADGTARSGGIRTSPTRSTPSRSSATPVTGLTTIDVAAQRVYHVTHLRNLPAIVDAGALLADARPEVDLSSGITRELRRSAEVADGVSVADSVPFYLSPDARLWQDVRSGAAGAHWSDAARRSVPTEFVVLVTTVGALDSPVVTDGDAAGSTTRFARETLDQQRLLRRLHSDHEALLSAEVLVPIRVPLDTVTLVGVANTRARDEVRGLVSGVPGSPKIAMYPPWFALPEAE